MNTLTTEKIKLWGIVQGVGFRPFVAKLADQMHMKGNVLNIGGLVEITVTDTPRRLDAFVAALFREKPKPAEIVHIKRTLLPLTEFTDFQIKGSAEGGDDAAMIPPDMAICPDCLKELYAEDDPRHLHPFISCMLCGPRYTIIDRIPYDRDNTSMIDFPMCGFCQVQYQDLHDRRHHAQTISCHACGPYLKWKGPVDDPTAPLRHTSAEDRKLLDQAARILADGGVIAFKCVGGYNLVADPFNYDAVQKLRAIKGRETKPFAVMFRDLKEVQYYCHISDVEANLLESSARPIILLEHKLKEAGFAPAANRRFPQTEEGTPDPSYTDLLSSRFIGSFLPSLAAQYLLLDRISPLIFTSANKSDLPMIKDDDEMTAWFEAEPAIDGILYNERQIRVRVDDSVCRVIDDQPQMIRRSKGYAPLPLYVDLPAGAGGSSGAAGGSSTAGPRFIFAAGSQLKNSFALTNGPFLYMSQYFGDLDTVENQQIYQENIQRMAKLLRIRPQAVVCDMHPLYESTIFAKDFAKKHGLPLLQVQHHHAHVASVMAENNLSGKVIGVCFDGTGYGTDGRIWGGEILLCEGSACDRFSHLKYVDMIGGDSSMKDAHRSALSHMASAAVSRPDIISYDDQGCRQFNIDLTDIMVFGAERMMGCPDARMILRAIDSGINTIQSSSMGRLFDAVSALLDIKEYNDFEGQCACMLEDAAAFAKAHPGADRASDLALAFHERVIDAIVKECRLVREASGANQVALTGGTFQNKILMEGVLEKLRALGFEPYYNISVSPNDGGIALGQAFIAMHSGR
ncbi:MAG: carbamoyltransferase HypF [Firmicutes bacterium]|nr:carbamoyltransferase HypF [Bacillota bacterium]